MYYVAIAGAFGGPDTAGSAEGSVEKLGSWDARPHGGSTLAVPWVHDVLSNRAGRPSGAGRSPVSGSWQGVDSYTRVDMAAAAVIGHVH